MSACPYCGWPDDQPTQTLSQHHTGDGLTVWTRCACGSLQCRVLTAGSVTITVRGQPADGRLTAPEIPVNRTSEPERCA